MVEGDLVDLTLPSLLTALSREGSTSVLRLQRGDHQGALYFREGALVHALSGETVGDQAVHDLLRWPDGRFRLVRDPDRQPRTVTHAIPDFLNHADQDQPTADPGTDVAPPDPHVDEQLLTELLGLLARLEQDRVRLEEGQVEPGGVPALLLVTAIVNSMIAFVTTRCSDPGVLPSHLLPCLAETQPYTQLFGEDNERISIATAAGVLKNWESDPADRSRLFRELCRALLDVLTMYCNTICTFFHESREREEWRTTFDVFVDGLWTAIQQVEV